MNILVLMGGPQIEHKGKKYPLYMTEVNKSMLIEKNVDLYRKLNPAQIIFCAKREDIKDFNIGEILKHLFKDSVCVSVYSLTKGAICTALLAMEYIDNDDELLITSIDEIIDVNYAEIVNRFRKDNLDVGLLSFDSMHPRYSYASLAEDGKVEEVAEKRTISNNALASFFYFRKGADFVKAAISVLKKDNPVQGSFFISQTINEMILLQKNIGLVKFDTKKFHPLKNEEQLQEYVFDNIRGSNENS